jgi:hypothetical protein
MLGALAGLILLCFLLVALAWLGARVARRYIRGGGSLSSSAGRSEDDWFEKPLQESDEWN